MSGPANQQPAFSRSARIAGRIAGRWPVFLASRRTPSRPVIGRPRASAARRPIAHRAGDIGLKFEREGERLGLAGIEVGVAHDLGNGEGRADFELRGQSGVGARQFGAEGGRDDDALEEHGEQMGEPRLQERGDG